MKTAVVTGTSSGIGLVTSVHLARAGYQVFAGMRNTGKQAELNAAAGDLPITVVEMDVTSEESTQAAFAQARQHGPIDVLVNNAGIGGASPLEIVPEAEHRAIFETNYFGAIRCMQSVLPEMRERKSGTIVNISSMEGLVAIPNQIPYSASKWALECAGEALAHEVRPFGIRVLHIEPGVIMTKIYENGEDATRYDKHSPYQPLMRRNGKMFAAGFQAGVEAERVAETVLEAIAADDYKLRWAVGDDARGLHDGRRRMSDEEWIEMGGFSDENYEQRFAEYFGIDLKLTRRARPDGDGTN